MLDSTHIDSASLGSRTLDGRRGPVGGITVLEGVGTTTARLWGEIDEALREQASSALVRALDRELPVVLDASEVEFIDSTGIAFLIQFCRIGREEGLPVTLHNPPQLVTDVLAMLGLERMFDEVTGDGAPVDEDAALAAARRAASSAGRDVTPPSRPTS